MTTNDINALAFWYKTAKDNTREALDKEMENAHDIELTLETVSLAGFQDGLEFGALQGFRHAIALLYAEDFTEHGRILESQIENIEAIFKDKD